MNIRFSGRELRDLAVAWVALGVAFTAFYFNRQLRLLLGGPVPSELLVVLGYGFVLSMLTAGIGFLLHELAHKVVAVHYGQLAEFRADYSMLFLAVMAGLAGFLFAAPGAVYHRGRITAREQGLIALAGPAVNVALVAVFAGVWIGGEAAGFGLLGTIGYLGVIINVLLAGFNMLPFGPLDGKKVMRWSRPVWAASAVPTIGGAIAFFLF
ncbi:zinc metalloprotease [Halapricum hydrolyticum]|uniref:Metalloprotease n=1 Tax=Halapricum hydrolyticum TaxID=2979991 RepID=A0AAE3I8Z0_9EURY|nr:metalloprotease [Halapricum hydrolyticum]MCU4716834.1 metalloprotease [Halapricum hydrolyticum]MCU4725561.1 metalloprotease [Halapricum hydrolyticum]